MTEDHIEAAIARIHAKGEQPRFDSEAYRWFFHALGVACRAKGKKHLGPTELVDLIAQISVDHFGLAAGMVWKEWGILNQATTGSRFSTLAWRLIDEDVLQAQAHDRPLDLARAAEWLPVCLAGDAARHLKALRMHDRQPTPVVTVVVP